MPQHIKRTEASIAANFVANAIEQGKDWKEALLINSISTNQQGNLYCLSYNHDDPDFWDPLVRECRGIILKITDTEVTVVCWPFEKFGNSFEPYAAQIDWNSAHAEEKLDGSIIKLYYNDNAWCWATNRLPHANREKANSHQTWLNLIQEAPEYETILNAEKDPTLTYIFELTSPKNQIVIKYAEPHLTHLATKSNITGKECETDLGIPKPKRTHVANLNQITTMAQKLNQTRQITDEGFVVVDKNYHRIKVKSARYAEVHYVLAQNKISRKRSAAILVAQDEEALQLIHENQRIAEQFEPYKEEYENALKQLEKESNAARAALDTIKNIEDPKRASAKFAQLVKENANDPSIWFDIKKNGYVPPKELMLKLWQKSHRGVLARMIKTHEQ